MPFYKLICRDCGNAFECQSSIAARTEQAIACPACGSRRVATDYDAGSAAVLRAKESGEGCPHGGCCHACERGR